MYTYALLQDSYAVQRSDGACIPNDPTNTDWRAYQAWLADGNTALEAPNVVAVPQSITRFQAKAALANAGLLDKVQAMMADTNTPILYRLAWEEALDFERGSATVKAMSGALNLTDEELDSLFTAAAAITG